MSWLYNHRDQLDGCRRYAEIAYRFRPKVLPEDRDDIEQDITIKLEREADKKDQVTDGFLWAVARNMVRTYWRQKYRERRRFCRLYEGDKGIMLANGEILSSPSPDIDARLDARALLKTLPKRMVEAGVIKAEGGKLNNADKLFLCRQRHRISKYNHAGTEEVERMRQLYEDEGLPCAEIARIVGMGRVTVQRHLKKLGVMRH